MPNYCQLCGAKTAARKASLCRECDLKRRKAAHTPQEYRRNWHLQKKYNLEPTEFDALWVVFKGRCGICDRELKLPTLTRGQALDVVAIDHNHNTGALRGLLCNACNKALGLFYDDIDRLKNAIKWLEMCNEKTSNN